MSDLRYITMVALAGLLTIVALFSLSLTGCNREDNQVDPMMDTRISETTIPAVDAAAPTRIETATFALG